MIEHVAARPRLALPFTIVPDGEVLHLIAGEDVRYTIHAGAAAPQLATMLARCDGSRTPDELLHDVPDSERAATRELLQRLRGERILINGAAEEMPLVGRYFAAAEGHGTLVECLHQPIEDASPLRILCQDTLDYHAALEFNRSCRHDGGPWLWVSTGPVGRAYVSPVFVADAGPCLECLLRQFQRLSPVSQLYDALLRHAAEERPFAPTSFPQTGLTILEQLANWKVEQMNLPAPSRAVYRLHVLELESMAVSVHRVFPDPFCPECTRARLVQ